MKKYYRVKVKDSGIFNTYSDISNLLDAFDSDMYGALDLCSAFDDNDASVEDIWYALNKIEDLSVEFNDKLNELMDEVKEATQYPNGLYRIENMIGALRDILNDISREIGNAESRLDMNPKFKSFYNSIKIKLDGMKASKDQLKSKLVEMHDAIKESGIKLLDKKARDEFIDMKLAKKLNKNFHIGRVNDDDIEYKLDRYCRLLENNLKEWTERSGYTFDPSLERNKFYWEKGRKYYKVIRSGGVHSFIDFEGNIYKPASWNQPASGIRATLDNPDTDWASGGLYR